MTDTLLDREPKASDVAAYLKRHPHFLEDYPDLAAQLTLPRSQGTVASLASYQLQNLRERNAELERRLVEFTTVAEQNERLTRQVHAFNLAVLATADGAGAMRTAIDRIDSDFGLAPARLVLFEPVPGLPDAPWLQVVGGAQALPEFATVLAAQQPITGRLGADRLHRLFGEDGDQVRSAAVLPLGDRGLLALGSADADHFQPGMGTLFLQLIAATVLTALQRR